MENTALSFETFKGNLKYELKLEKEGEKLDKNHLPFKWKWQIIDTVAWWHNDSFLFGFFYFRFIYFFVIIIITIMSSHSYLFSNST